MPRLHAPLAALCLIVLALAAPPAAAHGGEGHGFEQGKVVGDLYVYFAMNGAPFPLAGEPLALSVFVANIADASDPGVTGVGVRLTPPAGEPVELAPNASARGFVTDYRFPAKGTWVANVTLEPRNVSAEFTFSVYSASPYTYDSPLASSATGDIYVAGLPSDARLRVLEWRTGQPGPAPADATALVEHWTDDHKSKLSEKEVPLEPVAAGVYALRTTFEETGMYHVFLASPTLGIAYEDRPYVHMYAVSPDEARALGIEFEEPGKPTPGAGALAALAVVGAAAWAAARGRGR